MKLQKMFSEPSLSVDQARTTYKLSYIFSRLEGRYVGASEYFQARVRIADRAVLVFSSGGRFHRGTCEITLLDPAGKPCTLKRWAETATEVARTDIPGYSPVQVNQMRIGFSTSGRSAYTIGRVYAAGDLEMPCICKPCTDCDLARGSIVAM